MDYQIEELLPIVTELAQKYSGYESTSITYEKAQTLMGAVIYCLEEFNNAQADRLANKNIPIKEQYNIGVKLVYERAANIQKTFNALSFSFEDYGVKCLYDTIQKGIPQFLKWYDVKFNPQNTILTLDYPLLIDCSSLNGADAVYKYILGIQAEQHFLGMFDKSYIISVLKKYNPQYEYMIENICEIILTNAIGHIVLKKTFHEIVFHNDGYLQLTKFFEKKPVSDIAEMIKHFIQEMTNQLFENDINAISEYLYNDVENIAVRIKTACKFNQLNKIFLL